MMADNLLDGDFQADCPNQKWLSVFTCIWTAEYWLDVAVVPGLFSRNIVGWSMKVGGDAFLVMDALMMAVWRRGKTNTPLLHSGQGAAIHKWAVSVVSSRKWHHLLDKPGWQRLGQLCNGKLLLVAGNRTDCTHGLSHPRRNLG